MLIKGSLIDYVVLKDIKQSTIIKVKNVTDRKVLKDRKDRQQYISDPQKVQELKDTR